MGGVKFVKKTYRNNHDCLDSLRFSYSKRMGASHIMLRRKKTTNKVSARIIFRVCQIAAHWIGKRAVLYVCVCVCAVLFCFSCLLGLFCLRFLTLSLLLPPLTEHAHQQQHTIELTLGRAPFSAWRLSWNLILWLPIAISTSAILRHAASFCGTLGRKNSQTLKTRQNKIAPGNFSRRNSTNDR